MSAAGEYNGRVKWFDSVKGYGFLTTNTHSADFVIYRSVLNSVGIHGLPEGTVVNFVPEESERGMQVKRILAVDFRGATLLPKQRRSAGISKTAQEALLEEAGDFEPVEVKWFDWASGYGFLYASSGTVRMSLSMRKHCDIPTSRDFSRTIGLMLDSCAARGA